ncbi:head-to-tail connector protein [Mycobacterium phage Sneeze]|uniref:Head-to-tail connector protein n=1 Tax=Mycobacterium phage Rabbs TaxID=2530143 RepID=A0A481VSE9_9CAUD|nr:head-to-tail connector protein [Mycobacterium phage Sneeze]YP_010051353.1 hypothetical protein KDW71_gp08 [Mycobacterium phage Rabbs]ANU79722.1 head-to-tail connector protein [Mycobacterium phage Sneeze]QBI96762.1 hypothetical protein SEA_RABBS_8 [Mycobacterium phage Rabbs]
MRLMNEHGVVVNVPDALGDQLAGSGAWDRLGEPKPARKPAKAAAKKAAPAAKPADDDGDQGDAGAAGDDAQ